MTPEQREKRLKAIDRIESLRRPAKWREIKKLVLELHPSLVVPEREHCEACAEIRAAQTDTVGASKSLAMRGTMKMFKPVYDAINVLDPEALVEASGKNKGLQEKLGKQLWDAFPEYRIVKDY